MDNKHRNDYIVRKTYSSFVAVSVMSTLAATIGILVDNIIAGQLLGQDALSAMGIVSPISLIFSAIGNIFASGGTARAAQALGRGDHKQMCGVFTITIAFLSGCGILLTLPGMLFPEQIAVLLGARGELVPMAADYIFGFFMGALPTLMTTGLMGYLKLDGSPKLPLLSIVTMTVVNITLDFVMVVALGLEMFGMALATSLSYVAAVAVGCTHFLKPTASLRLIRPSQVRQQLGSMVVTGAPTAANRIADTIKTVVLNLMLISFIDAGAVAALNVRNQANNFLGALTLGMGSAIIPVAGMFYGEGDRTALRDTLKNALRLSLAANSVVAVLLVIFPEVLPSVLGVDSADALKMAAAAMVTFAVSLPVRAVNMAFINFYQATKRPMLSLVLCLLQSLVYTLAAAVALIFPLGSNGVWIAFVIGEVLTLATLAAVVAVRLKRAPRSIEDFMLLDESVGKGQRRLEFSTSGNAEEIKDISARLYELCMKRGTSEEFAQSLSLCIEEIAANTVKHSFAQGRKQWLDIIIINRQDEILMSFRDNGKAFNPLKNSGSDSGIARVRSAVKDISYKRSIGLNTLTLILEK